jgi:acyl-coenzyme A synthetase/AMP-(fatty) acid ligase
MTGRYVLDLHDDDVFWCTADPGWVTGTSLRHHRAAHVRRDHASSTRPSSTPRAGTASSTISR